jgi:hypothetical protein
MAIETGTILDADLERRPTSFWRRRQPATPLQLASAALEDCRCMQLEHAQLAEYHSAMLKMLQERDKRLVKDIQRLSKRPIVPNGDSDAGA